VGEVGTPAAHICAMESWMSAMALVSVALVATRFLMVVFLNGRVCQIVERRCHLLCLFRFGSLISTKHCLPSSHVIDIKHLGKGGSPMGLPVGPSVVDYRVMFPLAPGQRHVATCQGMLGTCGDHGFV
jgi:hypothetical protein